MTIDKYRTLIFDCDGVILNSNKVKSDAFYRTVLPYGEKTAEMFLAYHKKHGGVSRYKKFQYFLTNIVSNEIEGLDYNKLLKIYANEVFNGMLICEEASGLKALKESTKQANWLIVSGGDQKELREIFTERKLKDHFDGGIFGSPDSKEIIFKRELMNENIKTPALFIGDSKYDYMSSQKVNGIDFIFLFEWTEVIDWKPWVMKNKIQYTKNINSLILN